jgi:Family of unknown function (DUF5684)
MKELFASSDSSGSPAFALIVLVVAVLQIAGMWKMFQKAGHAGWLAIIPIVNIYILLKIAKRPGWWLILYIIPLVNIVVGIMVAIDVAKAFGKSTSFGVLGLWLFSFVGYPMLGFSDATYKKS